MSEALLMTMTYIQMLAGGFSMNPSTGDDNNIILFVIVGVLSLVLILALIILKIKKKK